VAFFDIQVRIGCYSIIFSSRVTQNADTTNLPPPSDKESVNVYLRIKPKTPEESEFYSCTDESDMVNIEDENFEVVTIESTHQVCVDQWS
jgi:hypothetical protein